MTPARSRARLSGAQRIARRLDFLAAEKRGRKQAGPHFVFFLNPRTSPGAATAPSRLGLTVSRRVGNAVVRNRVKRWIREAYRRQARTLPAGHDLVVIARPAAATVGYAATFQTLERLAEKRGRS